VSIFTLKSLKIATTLAHWTKPLNNLPTEFAIIWGAEALNMLFGAEVSDDDQL